MNLQFPPNPADGTVFEASPGVFYIYSSTSNSWSRIPYNDSGSLVTQTNDGLMSYDDYIKLSSMEIPPPQSAFILPDGTVINYPVGLESIDKFVEIDVEEENIHGNTGLINFDINIPNLVEYLKSTGQFINASAKGPTGPTGPSGFDGRDELAVGPYGPDGLDGANAPWSGTISADTLNINNTSDLAVVDVNVVDNGDGTFSLKITRGLIGNPFSCPNTILPKDIQSPWILGLIPDEFSTSIKYHNGPYPSNQTFEPIFSTENSEFTYTSQNCGLRLSRTEDGTLVLTCGYRISYFNIEEILQAIYDEWISQLIQIKAIKEAESAAWTQAMAETFEAQKTALCCSLKAVTSRARNQDARRYIETQITQNIQANRDTVIANAPPGPPWVFPYKTLDTDYDIIHIP